MHVTKREKSSSGPKPLVWLGQSVDTSSLCAAHPSLNNGRFLTSLGCAIRRPSLKNSHFNSSLKSKLGLSGPLMVDSGGFVLSKNSNSRWTIDIVAELFSRIEADVYVSLDLPPSANETGTQRRRKIRETALNFLRLSEICPDKNFMPVVHGRTAAEIELSIGLIQKCGSTLEWIGLGGMVPLLQRRFLTPHIATMSPELFIARALKAIRVAFPTTKIHVFGAGGTRTFPAVYALGANSADSIGWRQAAGFGSIFFPLKSQRVVKWDESRRPPRKTLDKADLIQLELCRCPCCLARSTIEEKLEAFQRSFYDRAIHNAWTVANQANFWPGSRKKLLQQVADGLFGAQWAHAAKMITKESLILTDFQSFGRVTISSRNTIKA